MQFNDYKTIKFERSERVLTVTLNLPKTMNAVGEALHTELSELFYDLQTDKGSDVIILTGAGKAFSAGGDVDQMKKNNESENFDTTQLVEAKKMIFGLLDLEKPIIAKINGDAMGLGATIALFCDIIFANEEARIADPHVSVGIVAGDGGAVGRHARGGERAEGLAQVAGFQHRCGPGAIRCPAGGGRAWGGVWLSHGGGPETACRPDRRVRTARCRAGSRRPPLASGPRRRRASCRVTGRRG